MKKFLYILMIILFLMPSCNEQLDRDWNNPNVYQPRPEQIVSGLFVPLQDCRFWLKDYGEWYWHLANWDQNLFTVSQLCFYVPYSVDYCNFWADDGYGNVENFIANSELSSQFNYFYTNHNNYSLIRDEVVAMTGDDYDNSVIYYKLATILKNIIALRTVDLFNSIPYFSSFRGSEGVFFTPYDDPMEIYKSVIEEYQAIASELPGIYEKMSALGKNTFEKQDIFFKGDANKWVKFINAQILKSCVRISGVAGDYVKPILAAAINNLPLEDYTATATKIHNMSLDGTHQGIRQRGFYEQYYQLCIPDVIMLRLNRGKDIYEPEIDDPRLPVLAIGYMDPNDYLAGKTDSVEYYGVSGNYDRNKYLRGLPVDVALPVDSCRRNVFPQINAQVNAIRPTMSMDDFIQACRWSYYNPITYVFAESPMYLFSRGEIDLLLAEVALKELANTGKAAGQHINDAVVHSTDFWYMMNAAPRTMENTPMSNVTRQVLTPDKPSASLIGNYASTIQQEFDAAAGEDGKMEILMQQKYIHLNIFEAFECFIELRRTRHPRLEPITNTGTSTMLVNQTMMVERFRLPASERTNNAEEYAKVAADDLWGKPVFWVPANKISEEYFLPTQLKAPLP